MNKGITHNTSNVKHNTFIHSRIGIIVIAIFLSVGCYAQSDNTFFHSSWFHFVPYGASLYADEHPYFFRCDMSATTPHPEYDYAGTQTRYKMHIYGLFGANINVWDGSFDYGRFGLSVAQTASANLWMDLLETSTSPVVNTDFRIGVPTVTFIHRTKKAFLRNYSIAFSPFMHESTHIGDELVLQRADSKKMLRRVNVSYNYAFLALTINEPEDRYTMTHTFRFGLMVLLNPREGWYFVESRDGEVNALPSDKPVETSAHGYQKRYGPSRMPIEMYLQYQFQSPCSRHGFQAVASAEIRNRALYAYSLNETMPASGTVEPRYTDGDRRRFTYNIFVGARYNMPNYDGYFSRFAVGIRAYHGNCPYGMFRSVDNFSHVGLCIIYQ